MLLKNKYDSTIELLCDDKTHTINIIRDITNTYYILSLEQIRELELNNTVEITDTQLLELIDYLLL